MAKKKAPKKKAPNPPSAALALSVVTSAPPPPPPEPEVIDEEGFTDDTWKHLQTRYKAKREKFIHEYIKDMNGSQALQRMGYVRQQPWITASIWLNEPYTQWYLSKLRAKATDDAIFTRSEILFQLKKEAHYNGLDGSAAARIAALRTAAKILGLEITKVEGNVNLQGGVMLMPFAGTPEEWEKAAQAAQAKLKQDVRL
jgi:hypothetical protein